MTVRTLVRKDVQELAFWFAVILAAVPKGERLWIEQDFAEAVLACLATFEEDAQEYTKNFKGSAEDKAKQDDNHFKVDEGDGRTDALWHW
jgi:hypothetical protein